MRKRKSRKPFGKFGRARPSPLEQEIDLSEMQSPGAQYVDPRPPAPRRPEPWYDSRFSHAAPDDTYEGPDVPYAHEMHGHDGTVDYAEPPAGAGVMFDGRALRHLDRHPRERHKPVRYDDTLMTDDLWQQMMRACAGEPGDLDPQAELQPVPGNQQNGGPDDSFLATAASTFGGPSVEEPIEPALADAYLAPPVAQPQELIDAGPQDEPDEVTVAHDLFDQQMQELSAACSEPEPLAELSDPGLGGLEEKLFDNQMQSMDPFLLGPMG